MDPFEKTGLWIELKIENKYFNVKQKFQKFPVCSKWYFGTFLGTII